MAVEKMKKGKRKFERKRKRYKLCRWEINATEELQIVAFSPSNAFSPVI